MPIYDPDRFLAFLDHTRPAQSECRTAYRGLVAQWTTDDLDSSTRSRVESLLDDTTWDVLVETFATYKSPRRTPPPPGRKPTIQNTSPE